MKTCFTISCGRPGREIPIFTDVRDILGVVTEIPRAVAIASAQRGQKVVAVTVTGKLPYPGEELRFFSVN